MALLSGITGYVVIGSTVYPFGKWKARMNVPAIKRNNFTSIAQLVVPGVLNATLNIDGPYNAGNMPLAAGVNYVFHLGFTTNLELVITAQVEDLTPDNDIDNAPNISLTCQSNGLFVAAVL